MLSDTVSIGVGFGGVCILLCLATYSAEWNLWHIVNPMSALAVAKSGQTSANSCHEKQSSCCLITSSRLYRHWVFIYTLLVQLIGFSTLAGRPTTLKSLFEAMSQQSYPPNPSSGYPPPQHTNYPPAEYKVSYDDLVDEDATPYGRNAQHQTFALESPVFGTSPQHRRGPSLSVLQQKQSFSSEYNGKFTEEDSGSQAPRVLPVKGEREVDTRSVWQKVCSRSPFTFICHLLTTHMLYKDLTGINSMPILCHYCSYSNDNRFGNRKRSSHPVSSGFFKSWRRDSGFRS